MFLIRCDSLKLLNKLLLLHSSEKQLAIELDSRAEPSRKSPILLHFVFVLYAIYINSKVTRLFYFFLNPVFDCENKLSTAVPLRLTL